jgi:hypothetical protein
MPRTPQAATGDKRPRNPTALLAVVPRPTNSTFARATLGQRVARQRVAGARRRLSRADAMVVVPVPSPGAIGSGSDTDSSSGDSTSRPVVLYPSDSDDGGHIGARADTSSTLSGTHRGA